MHKKKILLFVDWFTPGYKAGGPIESCANLVEHLKDEFDFSVVTRDTDYCENVPYPSVRSNEWNQKPGFRVYYFSKDQLGKANIEKLLREERYDIVHLNGMFSFYFTLIPLYLLRKTPMTIILASRGMLASGALGLKKGKKRLFLMAAKALGIFKRVLFHATNLQEAADIKRELGADSFIRVAPNFPVRDLPLTFPQREKDAGAVRLVNIARIAPEKNLKLALEVLKGVTKQVEFNIYGPVYDIPYWEECKKVISGLPSNVKVMWHNSIAKERVSQVISEHHFMFMPTLGENFGHIIIQSLSRGCPVIISDRTMWKDLTARKSGWDIPLNDKAAFMKAIDGCADMTAAEYTVWSQGAYDFAAAFILDPATREQNLQLFNTAA